VQIWRTTSPGFNDSVVMFGSTGGYDIKFYELLEPITPPTMVQNS
jgi:hypothetical protein